MIDEERVGYTEPTTGWNRRKKNTAGIQENGTEIKKKTMTRLEYFLSALVNLLEIVLNFMVVLCLETAVASLLKEEAPLWKLMLPLFLPLLFYAIRKKCRFFIVFVLAHIAGGAVLFYLAGFMPHPVVWRIMWSFFAFLYAVSSFRIRLTKDTDEEGELSPAFCGAVAVILFFLCSYLGTESGGRQILWISFVWILGHLLKQYMENFLQYVEMNRSSSGMIPEKGIFQSGFMAVGTFSIFSVLLLIVCAQTAFADWLSEAARKGGLAILRFLFRVLSLFGSTEKPEAPAVQQNPEPVLPPELLAESSPTPVWMEALEKILITAILIALIIGAVLLLAKLIHQLIQLFYRQERKKTEVLTEGVLEEEEHLGRQKKEKKQHLPMFGGTPKQRVRRIFKKTVLTVYKDADAEKIGSQTVREIAVKAPKSDGWQPLCRLYERARYTEEEISREEVREAGRASRKILSGKESQSV